MSFFLFFLELFLVKKFVTFFLQCQASTIKVRLMSFHFDFIVTRPVFLSFFRIEFCLSNNSFCGCVFCDRKICEKGTNFSSCFNDFSRPFSTLRQITSQTEDQKKAVNKFLKNLSFFVLSFSCECRYQVAVLMMWVTISYSMKYSYLLHFQKLSKMFTWSERHFSENENYSNFLSLFSKEARKTRKGRKIKMKTNWENSFKTSFFLVKWNVMFKYVLRRIFVM